VRFSVEFGAEEASGSMSIDGYPNDRGSGGGFNVAGMFSIEK